MPFLLLRTLRYGAAGLLLLSLLLPWYRVPVSVHRNLQGGYAATVSEPVTTVIFKIFLLLVFVVGWWLGNRHRRSGTLHWATLVASCSYLSCLFIVIAYPALTIQRCAALSAHAAWMQQQNASMIRVQGDVRTAQEFSHRSGQPEVYVKEVLPRTFVVVSTPVNSFFKLRLANLAEILTWLGFCPTFSEFARLGWFSGVFGSFLLAISFSRTKIIPDTTHREVSGVHGMVSLVGLGALLLCLLCLTPVVMAGRELEKSREAASEGHFGESLRHLDAAEILIPVLAYQTDAIYQRGWLDRKLGAKTWEAQLNAAIREETEGFDSRAAEHYLSLLEADLPQPVRNEAFRGTLRLAINDLNTGLLERAAGALEQLLAIDPTCLKANYALQLADLRSLRKGPLEDDVARFSAVYGCMQSIEKRVVIAAAHNRVAQLDFDARDTTKLGNEMRAAIGQ
jgi:tetratricopeptide (TPR) repeat protein